MFPEITFSYQKDEFIKVKLELIRHDTAILKYMKLKPEDLQNIHSEAGDQGRISALTLAHNVSEDFFRFNEAAFRHVRAATSEYCTRSHHTQLDIYCHMAETT